MALPVVCFPAAGFQGAVTVSACPAWHGQPFPHHPAAAARADPSAAPGMQLCHPLHLKRTTSGSPALVFPNHLVKKVCLPAKAAVEMLPLLCASFIAAAQGEARAARPWENSP